MNNNTLSAIELYMRRIFKIAVFAVPLAGLCAGLTFTAIKMFGYYNDVKWLGLVLLDVFCLLYFAVGLLIVLKCEDKNGILKSKALKHGKIYIAIVIAVQWNLISYLIPSRDFWAYSIFFVMFAAAFLDHKFLLVTYAEVYVGILISWLVRGDKLLPIHDELYTAEMILRGVFLILSFVLLWLTVYSIQTKLAYELEKIADYDTLTMLHNRRSMENSISKLIKDCNSGSTQKSLTLFMCDIDDFKAVNDTYGHSCGDEILKYVANVIIRDIGKNDLVFRYGGEEIVIVINGDKKTANEIAEKIRTDIEQGYIQYGDTEVGVTLTFGGAVYSSGMTVDNLVNQADSKLYIGKNNGKNQVVI